MHSVLNEKERNLLSAIEIHAGQSLETIASKTGVKVHTAAYILRKLKETGVISIKRPFIDLNRLGFTQYTLLFALTSRDTKAHQKLEDFLLKSPEVTWMYEIGGDYQYGISITVRRTFELINFMQLLSDNFGKIFIFKSYVIQDGFHYFGRRYLGSNLSKRQSFYFELGESEIKIDETDEKVISAMVYSSYESLREQAREACIPQATFQRRKEQLEINGVIRGYFYRVNYSMLGMQLYNILINVRGLSSSFKENITNYARDNLQVVSLIECLGEWDFEIQVEVSTQKELSQLTQSLYNRYPTEIQSIKTIPYFNYLKFKSFVGSKDL